jgi:hypothetical protein
MQKTSLIFWTGILLTACAEPANTPKTVQELSRLLVLDLAAVAQLVNADESCGFQSPTAIATQTIDGENGREGSVTRTVEGCLLDLDATPAAWPVFACDEDAGRAHGKVRVSGTWLLGGRVTRETDERPVIPGGPDALFMELQIEPENFAVERYDEGAVLTLVDGTAYLRTKVRLAAALPDRFCEVATPNADFQEILYEGSVSYKDVLREKEHRLEDAVLAAVSGAHSGRENMLTGELVLDDQRVVVDQPLDHNYDAAELLASWACDREPELELPATFACDGVGDLLAQNSARLAVLALSQLIDHLDGDATCGFGSVVPVADAPPGGFGTLTYRVEECVLDLPNDTLLDTDCFGVVILGSGRVVVSAEKTIQGRITGDLEDPVIPVRDDTVHFHVSSAVFDNFRITETDRAIVLKSGKLSGKLQPRVALDTEDEACAFVTDIARIEDVLLEDAALEITTVSGTFETRAGGSFRAVSGAWNGEENLLTGRLVMAGKEYSIPTDPSDSGLDPDYNPALFDLKWACGASLARPVRFECPFGEPLAESAARLSLATLGAVAELIEDDERCGFKSPEVMDSIARTGEDGRPGNTGTFTLGTGCEIRLPPGTIADTDCNGKRRFLSGTLRVTGTKTLLGWSTGDPLQPIIPTARDHALLELAVQLENFELYDEARPKERIFLGGARLRGKLQPRLAKDLENDSCSIATPVVTLSEVAFDGETTMTMTLEGKRFDVRSGSMSLAAQAGNKDGVANTYSGLITVDGQEYRLPIDGDNALDPDYDQTTFDTAYTACEPNQHLPATDEECDYYDALGIETARLAVKAASAMVRLVNEDEDCGFADDDNLKEPAAIIGDEDQLGSVDWTAPRPGEGQYCPFVRGPGSRLHEDCIHRRSYLEGGLLLHARRHVVGVRAEKGPVEYANPTSPDAPSDTWVETGIVNQVRVYHLDPGEAQAEELIHLHGGMVRIHLNPIMAEHEDEDDFTYLVPTPVARFQDVNLAGVETIVRFDNKTFKLFVDTSSISAFSGAYNGDTNRVGGTITLDGRRVTLPVKMLDPDYDQQIFDRRYVCTDDMERIVPLSFP